MSRVIFYEKPGCAGNGRQKRLLETAGHTVLARNLLTEPWTAERLRAFFGARPVLEWFNRNAPKVKAGEVVPETLDATTALTLLLADPLLIRRPLMEAEGQRVVGFDPVQVHAWIGLAECDTPAADLETCRRDHAPCPTLTPGPTLHPMNDTSTRAASVRAYHERTKHSLVRYAPGPETLDWTAQPDPFREYRGAHRVPLPLPAAQLAVRFTDLYAPGAIAPQPLTLDSLGALLQLSLAISAWKEYGQDRWALRCNPSSGNLHPTEAYVIGRAVPGLADGVYHYASRTHALEQRCAHAPPADAARRLWIGLASIHWREAWKYGERAFRYCQLDIGHALGALRYAAGVLGWTLRLVDAGSAGRLAALLGLDRDADYTGAEREEPDLLVEVLPATSTHRTREAPILPPPTASHWTGQANVLDPHPMYRWPVIDTVAAACRKETAAPDDGPDATYPPLADGSGESAVPVILNRRSAQRFDARASLSSAQFYRLLDCLLPRPVAPWDAWPYAPRLHLILFVHRVEGLAPGLYTLPRRPQAEPALRAALRAEFVWQRAADCPAHLPLYQLQPGDARAVARTLSCHQAIAADSCFALSMLAEFEDLVRRDPWHYRPLHWEAGLLGQVLYLEAEAIGLRGTGIGCYFDDAVHELLGLRDARFQSLYHFTVGGALTDTRITTLPPYPARAAHPTEASP